jgi:ligand-binding sensor domain-containing protein
MKKLFIFFFLSMVVMGSCFAQNVNNAQRIVGTWTDIEGYTWVFSADGKLTYDDEEYRYSVFDGERRTELTIFEVEYSMYIAIGITDQEYTMEYSRDGKTLRLTGAENLNGWSVAGPGWGTNQLTRK